MSVTESKAKAGKKATRKKAQPVVSAELTSVLEQASVELMPLSALVVSPFNVRAIDYPADSVRELADSIAAVGLLQNLVVHAMPDGKYGVAAGGRRLAAMHLLATGGTYKTSDAVPVKIVPDELAVAASMTENGQRKDMHPAEQIVGFRKLEDEGKTPAQIGDLLGYGSRHVQRMLKLANLAPSVLYALAKDELTTEHCHALALESDPARQVQVLDAARQKGYQGKPYVNDIRSMITADEVSTGSNKFQFVGVQAFSPEEIRVDLFSDEQGGYVDALALDTALLEKLQQTAGLIREAEGWGWCAGRMDRVRWHGEDAKIWRLADDVTPVYSAEEQQRLDELNALYDENDTVCEESAALQAEMELIDCMAELRAFDSGFRAGAGVVVSWNNGEIDVQRGVVLKEQADAAGGPEAEKKTSVITYTREPHPADEISLPLVTRMASERTLAVQAALMQQSEKAVALLAWTLSRQVFSGGSAARNPFKVSLDCAHYSLCNTAPSGREGAGYVALMAEGQRLEALLPEGWRQDFTLFLTLDGNVLLKLLGFCLACSVNGGQTREYGRTSDSPLDALETALGFHLRDWWQPTKDNLFAHMTKPQIIDALNEAGATGAARDAEKMKKGDAAELAEASVARNRWVPVWMRGPDAEKYPGQPENPPADAENTAHDAQTPASDARTASAA